jgi:hypothetical protein
MTVWLAIVLTGVLVGLVMGSVAVFLAANRRSGLEGQAARREAVRRELSRIDETPVARVNDGDRVRIKGRAQARGPLRTSPVSQRACICFRLTVEASHGGDWHRVFEQDEFDSFLLTDDTGQAVLQAPFQLQLDPYDARSENVPQVVIDLVKQSGANITLFGSPDTLRYAETILQPGDEIVAVGRATVEVSAEGRAWARRGPPVICTLKGDGEPVVLADG